jgi:hypothetical protein
MELDRHGATKSHTKLSGIFIFNTNKNHVKYNVTFEGRLYHCSLSFS